MTNEQRRVQHSREEGARQSQQQGKTFGWKDTRVEPLPYQWVSVGQSVAYHI